MISQEEAISALEARARLAVDHLDDSDFITAHKDPYRALVLALALNGEQLEVDAIKDALRHGENALLVRILSLKSEALEPAFYVKLLSVYALSELDRVPMLAEQPPLEDMWAMAQLIAAYYEPVPFAPYTREQLRPAIQEDLEA